MNKATIKRIFKIQRVKPKPEYRAICIKCDNRSLLLEVGNPKAYCYLCKRSWDVEEVLMMVEDKYVNYEHSDTSKLMQGKGINQ